MSTFRGLEGGASTRFGECEGPAGTLGAVRIWLHLPVFIGLGLSPSSIAQTTVTYIHTDVLGSVVAESDANGNVIRRYEYEPYGAIVDGQVTDGPGYTGHVSDSATGLSYMQQRYMDPQLGVFLSVDPVTAYEQPVGQFNRYRYANGNPYRFRDSDGRSGKPILPFMDRIEVRSVQPSGAVKVERMPQSDMGPTIAQGTVILLPQRSMQGEPATVG